MSSWPITRVLVLTSIALIAGFFWWLADTLVEPAVQLTGAQRQEPDYSILRFRLTSMNVHGTPKYILEAASLVHYPTDQSTRIDKPRLVQFDDAGVPTTTTADSGWVSRDGKKLIMSGNVRVARGPDTQSAGGEVASQQLQIILN